MAGARELKQDLYVFQCTADTRPKISDYAGSGGIRHHQLSRLAARHGGPHRQHLRAGRGQPDERKSWASLAPLLDHRRCVESIIAGILIKAHADFRCCVTMNEDVDL